MVWNINRNEIMGRSGFKVNYKIGGGSHWKSNPSTAIAEVIDINTKETIFILTSIRGLNNPRTSNTKTKTFLGLDNRYYHISISVGSQSWGQVQSDGAVIGKDRTILKHLNFYPMDVTPTTVPTLKPIVKAPATPVISTAPAVVSIITPPVTTKEEISCLKKIKNLLIKIKMWIINLLNR